ERLRDARGCRERAQGDAGKNSRFPDHGPDSITHGWERVAVPAALTSRAMTSGAEEFKAFEAAGWSRRASTYGRVTGAITARFVDPLLDAAGVGDGMRVLDVATGPGH